MSQLELITAPTTEPVTLTELKSHLRIVGSTHDTVLNLLILGVREHLERMLGRAFITQTWTYWLDKFPAGGEVIELPRPPLKALTWVKYTDTPDGNVITWDISNYTVDKFSTLLRGRVFEAWDKTYPDTRDIRNAVEVKFNAGYGAASAVPTVIKVAFMQICGHWYEHREAVADNTNMIEVPILTRNLLTQYRVDRFK